MTYKQTIIYILTSIAVFGLIMSLLVGGVLVGSLFGYCAAYVIEFIRGG